MDSTYHRVDLDLPDPIYSRLVAFMLSFCVCQWFCHRKVRWKIEFRQICLLFIYSSSRILFSPRFLSLAYYHILSSLWTNFWRCSFLRIGLFTLTMAWLISYGSVPIVFHSKEDTFSIQFACIKLMFLTFTSIANICKNMKELWSNHLDIFELHLRGLLMSISIHTRANRPLDSSSEFHLFYNSAYRSKNLAQDGFIPKVPEEPWKWIL